MESTHTSQAPTHTAADYAQRAADRARLAADSVLHQFAHRPLGVPGTLLGSVQVPETRPLSKRLKDWHYWWQAHFLECVVDAGERELHAGNRLGASEWLSRARALVRGINARNHE